MFHPEKAKHSIFDSYQKLGAIPATVREIMVDDLVEPSEQS